MDLVKLAMQVYANGSLVIAQDCAMYPEDWDKILANPEYNKTTIDGTKRLVSHACSEYGTTTLVIYKER